jgi:hypothetical protein
MESDLHRSLRVTARDHLPRQLLWILGGFIAIFIHRMTLASVLGALKDPLLHSLYLKASLKIIYGSLGGVMVLFLWTYHHYLRDRQAHTAMTTTGRSLRWLFVASFLLAALVGSLLPYRG